MNNVFKKYRVFVPSGATGEIRLKCPQCTPTRKHKNEKDLSVNIEKGTGFCQHCGWSFPTKGDTVEEYQSKNYTRPAFIHSELSDEILKFFEGRGIHQKVLGENQISAKNGAIQFPYFKDGVCVNIKTRTLDKRFFQEKNTEPCLYRFDFIASCEEIIICEGELDALACCEAGMCNVTSVPNGAPPPNAKNYTREFEYLSSAMPIFQNCKKVVIAVDNDAPGKVLEQELARRIGVEKCWRTIFPKDCKDANDVLVKYGRDALKQCISNSSPYPVEGIYNPSDVEDLVLHLYDNGAQCGVSTGWPRMDEFYTVKTGQMTIVTGIPGSGKSNWIDALMVNLAIEHNWSFAIFSPENWPIERHIQSIVEKLNKRPFFGRPRLPREVVQEAIGIISSKFYFIFPPENQMTLDAVLEKARVAIFRNGVKGIVIDPWNELDHEFGRLTETQYISSMLGKIRRFARRNDTHIWVVAHPTKMIKDQGTGVYPVPTMYDIAGGAHWRNKADVGICVHRPDLSEDITDVYVQKVRFREIGRLGGVQFRYARDTGNYTDYAVLGIQVNDRSAQRKDIHG